MVKTPKTEAQDNAFVDTVAGFFALAQKIGRDERVNRAELRRELEQLAPHIRKEGGPDQVATAMMLIQEAKLRYGAPEPIQAEQSALTLKAPEWETHDDRKGIFSHYTAEWEGMSLRVDRKRGPDGKIVFIGFIDDKEVFRGKGRLVTREEVASKARARLLRREST